MLLRGDDVDKLEREVLELKHSLDTHQQKADGLHREHEIRIDDMESHVDVLKHRIEEVKEGRCAETCRFEEFQRVEKDRRRHKENIREERRGNRIALYALFGLLFFDGVNLLYRLFWTGTPAP